MVRGWWYKVDEQDMNVWGRVEGEGMVVQGSLTRRECAGRMEGEGMVVQGSLTRHACAGRMEGEGMVVQGRCRTEK